MSTDTLERPAAETAFQDTPCIYADGKRDDVPGLVAAYKNERVEHDGRIYEPGETLTVDGDNNRRTVTLSARLIIRGPDAKPFDTVDEIVRGPYVLVNVTKPTGRAVHIVNCCIKWTPTKEWPAELPHAFWFDDVDIYVENNTTV